MKVQSSSFFAETFMPHGYCLEWRPDILWLNVISDLFIAVAYFSIPVVLVLFIRKRKDIQFQGIFILFALFILLCGITHLMSIYNMWHGAYGLQGILKALTALVSIITAYVAFKNLEQAIAIPSRKEFENALRIAAHETIKGKKIELEQKNQEIFKFITELLPSGLLVINEQQIIVMTNAALAKIFGYSTEELIGKPLSLLIDKDARHHSMLVQKYINNPEQSHKMAAGRVVRGVHKEGNLVDIQINLSVHAYAGDKLTFASVTDFGTFLFEQEQQNELSNRVNRAIDASEDGIWEWNVQSNKVWYSPRFMYLIGKAHKTTSQLDDWLEHIHPEFTSFIKDTLDKHFIHKEKFDVTYRGLAKAGTYEWFRMRGDSIFDEQGQAILMSGILSNINDKKILEDELEEKSRFLNQVLQRSLTGLYIFDLDTQYITYINPEYTNLTGYQLDEVDKIQSQFGFKHLFHPDDVSLISAHQTMLLKLGVDEGQGIEYRFRHKSGEWCWFYARESVYSYHKDGQPKELLGTFFNISDLKHRENEIRKLALDYATTFEQSGVGIAHINLDCSFIKANSKFLEIFSYPSFDDIDVNFFTLCDEVDRIRLTTLVAELPNAKKSLVNLEKRFIRTSGDVFWADLTISYVNPAKGDLSEYLIVILQDISERKLMEQNLSESNQALERFAYSASHDLQEPLRKISAFAGSLDRRLRTRDQDPEILFQLERICDASVRMGKMIDNLLKLSRANSESLIIREVNLSMLLVQTLDDISQKTKGLALKVLLQKDRAVPIDINAFSQVIRNLLSNSIAYRDQSRELIVVINTKEHKKHITIEYSDNGIGFSAEKSDVIFEPFTRLVSKEIPGTGMGLTICKQVMKAHGGRIYASKNSEKGAKFIIEVPKQAV